MGIKEVDMLIADAIMERPTVFRMGDKNFYLYPITLGKKFLMQRIVNGMGIESVRRGKDINVIILRSVKENRDSCCELLSYMTARNEYDAVFDYEAFLERKNAFSRMDDGDLASLMLLVLTFDKTEIFMKQLGIDVEQKSMMKVIRVKEKSDKNFFTFGGVSLYGSLIDVAMERYSLTKRQIVWEIDYTSLRLLLADRVNSILVNDDERKKIHIQKDRTKVSGDDKESIKKIIASQSWE